MLGFIFYDQHNLLTNIIYYFSLDIVSSMRSSLRLRQSGDSNDQRVKKDIKIYIEELLEHAEVQDTR